MRGGTRIQPMHKTTEYYFCYKYGQIIVAHLAILDTTLNEYPYYVILSSG